MKVAFCHPDLGLGGAERLIVDAAAELAGLGHDVEVWTAFHDPARCFEETVGGPFGVKVRGGWIPRSVLGRAYALCAYLRAILPLRILSPRTRVLFYCHFPDLLLASRGSLLRRAYRAPIDWLEEVTTGMAHAILVNSKYTEGMFASTFRRLHARGTRPHILHPAVRLPPRDAVSPPPPPLSAAAGAAAAALRGVGEGPAALPEGAPVFLSINRFERKKNIGLALTALSELRARGGAGSKAVLVVAGGYDTRLPENVEHLEELRRQAEDLGLEEFVAFVPSFTDAQRAALLESCLAVLYTPENEHFGIVPLEAMASCRPVIACSSGGPLESIADGKSGFLCRPDRWEWSAAMSEVLREGQAEKLGRQARDHVEASFSRAAFGRKLERYIKSMCSA